MSPSTLKTCTCSLKSCMPPSLSGKCFCRSIFIKFSNSLPWDQSTPIGYFAEICYDIFVSQSYLILNGAFLILFISLCFHFDTFNEMFQHLMQKFNDSKQMKDNWKVLCIAIDFQCSIRRCAFPYMYMYNIMLAIDMFLFVCVFFLNFFCSLFLLSEYIFTSIITAYLLFTMCALAGIIYEMDLVTLRLIK